MRGNRCLVGCRKMDFSMLAAIRCIRRNFLRLRSRTRLRLRAARDFLEDMLHPLTEWRKARIRFHAESSN